VADQLQANLICLTVDLVRAYVANHEVAPRTLPDLISTTHEALAALGREKAEVPEPKFEPAVSVRKSLGKRDHILSMIDGKPYRMLKRHISRHGLTPESYRARYNLPADYPMVAPAYRELRSETAKRTGFGRKPKSGRKSRARSA
jgi:predicted transcriptional regulator